MYDLVAFRLGYDNWFQLFNKIKRLKSNKLWDEKNKLENEIKKIA